MGGCFLCVCVCVFFFFFFFFFFLIPGALVFFVNEFLLFLIFSVMTADLAYRLLSFSCFILRGIGCCWVVWVGFFLGVGGDHMSDT